MTNFPEIIKLILIRLLIAAPLAFLGLSERSGVLGPAFLLAAAIVVASPFARAFAESSGSLFYPADKFTRKQPMYSIPEARRSQGLYEEAITAYMKIAEDYPGEIKPYIGMIEIAIVNLSNEEKAKEFYVRGMSRLKNESDRKVLTEMYTAIRSRLGSQPSN